MINVLIIDDEEAYRLILELYLKSEGWTVHTASNGAEGLEKLDSVTVDCVVCDLAMPVMDGVTFHSQLRAVRRFANLPILFVSGYDDPPGFDRIRDIALTGFLRKTEPLPVLKASVVHLTRAAA